jgi:hypothetical protein
VKSATLLKIAVFVGLIGLCVAGRLLPHNANSTPLAGAALFAGYFFARRRTAIAVPLAAMLVSDAFIGGYQWQVMIAVYAAFAFPVLLRRWVRSRGWSQAARVAGCTLMGSAVFFLVTNFAHWAFFGMYPLTGAGLAAAYVDALPFLRNTVTGDLFWSAALFGTYAAATRVRRMAMNDGTPAETVQAALVRISSR